MALQDAMRVLGFSKKEKRVFLSLQEGNVTPLMVSRDTKISRPAIYAILKKFHKRGLVTARILNGKRHWEVSEQRDIDEVMYNAKRSLLRLPEGRQEVYGRSDAVVIIHRGRESVKTLVHHLLVENKNQRLYGIQGDVSKIGWDITFSLAETNRFNKGIKENNILVEAVLPDNWFAEQVKILGSEWAKEFEGRATRAHEIDKKYFSHGGQIFIFKESLYLFALNEEIIIEVRNSEIQKMILSLFMFIQDHSSSVDANDILRKLIVREKTHEK